MYSGGLIERYRNEGENDENAGIIVRRDYESLGDAIRDLRAQYGVSQEKFGEMAGISGSYVSSIEKNNAPLSPQTFKKILENLKIKPKDREYLHRLYRELKKAT